MRILSLRLIVALIVGITLVSLASSWYEVRDENYTLRRDLERKALPLGESLAANAESFEQAGDRTGLEQMAQQYTNRDHLQGIAIFSVDGSPLVVTRALDSTLSPPPQVLRNALDTHRTQSRFTLQHLRPVYLQAIPLHDIDKAVVGAIVVVHDAGYIQTAIFQIWGRAFVRMAINVLVIVVITLLILRWSLAGPVARMG